MGQRRTDYPDPLMFKSVNASMLKSSGFVSANPTDLISVDHIYAYVGIYPGY